MATLSSELQSFNDLIIAATKSDEVLPFQQALDALDVSIDDFKVVHVAGTNGKSSVCYKVAAGLESLGHQVGLFISPHIWRFNERIMIQRRPIDDAELLKILQYVSERIRLQELHFFSVYLLVALIYFKRCNVEWVVLETGIGGTHDKTNWGRHTRVAVVTSIGKSTIYKYEKVGYDHMHVLGKSLDQIARQKAGIVKAGCTLVLGPNVQPVHIFQEACDSCGAKMIQMQLKSYATYDAENSDIARTVLEQATGMDVFGIKVNSPTLALRLQRLSPSQIERARLHMIASGSCKAQLLSQGPPEVVFDVAHNASAIDRLYADIAKFNIRKLIICAAVSYTRHIDILNPARCCNKGVDVNLERVYLLPSKHPRIKLVDEVLSDLDGDTSCDAVGTDAKGAASFQGSSRRFLANIKKSIKDWCNENGGSSCSNEDIIKTLLPEALPKVMHDAYIQASKNQCLLLITGSFYIMQEACNALGFETF